MTKTTKVMPTKKAQEKTITIGRVKAAELISNAGGRFFTVVFESKKGERKMTCRKSVTKSINPNAKKKAVNTEALGMVTVYDMFEKAYRKVNLQTVSALRINKQSFRVK